MSRALGRSYAAIWAATAGGAVAGLAGFRLIAAPAPYDALAAVPHTALGLIGANAVIALWPLGLLLVRWHQIRALARLADSLIRAQLLGNGLVVGNALGQHPRLALYLPHLPLEWLAIATPAAAWLAARDGGQPLPVLTFGATAAALVAAALVETYLVPIG